MTTEHRVTENNEALFKGLDTEKVDNRGRLKIFLGYCAGVGKTYRMLQDAIINKNNGTDVVIGLVETHERVDTKSLVSKLEVLPRKNVHYVAIEIHEMDLDAILARHPQLVLVDELAHTNIPGSRHAKRYQDVEELLNAGINVYTTLNIQHIHSLVDIVHQITGVKVDETIPNWVLESADEIELVDLSPEKLQQRLADGKVYIPQKAKVAMQRFFRKGNLLALRELSLKYTAKRVDIDLLSYREREDISDVWPVESKLLVGISTNVNTEKVLLVAHRMAADLEAEWYAVHVESLQQVRYTEKSRNQLYRNISFAEELGAKVVALSGNNIADEVVDFAKQKNVTLIITGLSQRSPWQKFVHGSVLDNLVKKASPINVLVVGGNTQMPQRDKPIVEEQIKLRPYVLGAMGILLVFLLGWLFPRWIFTDNLLMILLLPTIVSGILGGTSVGFFTSLLSLGLYDFFFIDPIKSFAVADLRYLSNILLFILIVIGVSWVGRMIRWRADSARYRERFVYALYNFSREILSAENSDEILNRSLRGIVEAFDSDVVIMLPRDDSLHENLVEKVKSKPSLTLDGMEQAVAIWVYKNGRHAGKGTNTLSSTRWYYVPLQTRDRVLGVICLVKTKNDTIFTPEQKRLLEAFSGIVALALTRAYSR